MKKLKIEDPKSHKLNVICVKSTLDKSVVSNERHHSHSGVYEGERKAGKCMVLAHIHTLMELNM